MNLLTLDTSPPPRPHIALSLLSPPFQPPGVGSPELPLTSSRNLGASLGLLHQHHHLLGGGESSDLRETGGTGWEQNCLKA